jgi:hypothetical protein
MEPQQQLGLEGSCEHLNVDIRLQQVSQISLFNVIYFHAVITQKIRTPSEEKRKEKNIYNKII